MRLLELASGTVAIHEENPTSISGSDMVFIHGAGYDHTAWRFQTRFFAGLGHRVLALDLPGHGRSEGPPHGTIEQMGEWLTELLDVVGARSPVIVGHSMGSYVALQHASAKPDDVGALVLLGTTDRMRVHPELLESAARRDRHAIDLMVGWMHTGTQRFGGHRSPGSWSAGTSRRTLERNLAALGSDLAACDRFDPEAVASNVSCRTLVVSGDADRMTQATAADRLAGMIAACEHVVIGGAGHMALSEQSVRVNASIAAFLKGAAAPSGTRTTTLT